MFARMGCFAASAAIAFLVACVAAWIHALVFCINHLDKPYEIIVLLVGILPPVGVIHGFLLWFGAVTQ